MKCPAEITLEVIGGRWKLLILWQLLQGVKRFSELQRALTGISQKMLTQQLREMERDHVIEREVFAQVPPKVEYSLTALGESLRTVVEAMCEWGIKLRDGKLTGTLDAPLVGAAANRDAATPISSNGAR